MALLTTVPRLRRRLVQVVLMAMCAAWISACGSTEVTTSTSPSSVVRCGLTLSVPDTAIEPSGGSEQVTLTTTPDCAWTASADANWIARIDPASGQGSGVLRVDVGPNPAASTRQAAIVVNGVRAMIQQEPAPCQYAVSGSGAQQIGFAGGTFQVNVTTTSGCTWEVTSGASWMRVASGSPGTGSGVVAFTVDPNDGNERVSALAIAGQSFAVTQSASPTPGPAQCTYSLNPAALPVPASGGAGSLLSLTTTCAWTATTNVPWITLTSPGGNGSAPIGFTVGVNTGSARSGTISIGSATATINQAAAAPCSYTLDPTIIYAPSTAYTDSVKVSTAATCNWTATSNASWIRITSGGSGPGNGTIGVSVDANPGGSRGGTVTVGSNSFTVSQADAPCAFGLSPTNVDVPNSGSTNAPITVSTLGTCNWTATSGAPWITIASGGSGSGNGTIRYNVAANTGGPRSSTITVGSSTTTINQGAAPCGFTLSATAFDVPAAAGNRTINVTSGASCNWTATKDAGASWITITSGASGSGNGSVGFSFTANMGTVGRSATLTVAGQTVTVNQAGVECNLSVSPLTFSIAAGGATNQAVTVTGPIGCAWTATSNAPSWLTITTAPNDSGNGTVRFNVAANPGTARNGTLTVAGQTVTVSQAAPACSYNLSQTNVTVPSAGGPGPAITVTAAAGCTWTAAATATPWLTNVAPASGSGNGTVTFSAMSNPDGPRSGTLTIAGQAVTVNQQGCTYVVGVVPLSFPGNGGTALATVTTAATCTWSGSSQVPWIMVPGGNHTGSGTLTITVQANPDNKSRTGGITVAGKPFDIEEAKK